MNFQDIFKKTAVIVMLALVVLTAGLHAQDGSSRLVVSEARQMPVATGNNLYCAGYVQKSPVNTTFKLIGAENEQELFNYSQNDFMYVNMGSGSGIKEGDLLSVTRPRGQVATRWTSKNGGLGFYVQEVGALEVVRVKSQFSVVRVKTSCDSFLLGDLVAPMVDRSEMMYAQRTPLDPWGDPSGKATGRIFLARDNQEMVGRDQIVYVDLGQEDNVKTGDYMTVFRPLGKGHLFISDEKETLSARDEGFHSDKFRGGKFSNQAPRKRGETARGRIETTESAKSDRPSDMRKIVGEAVVLNVKERTATVMITRTVQEIVTGDWVELQ